MKNAINAGKNAAGNPKPTTQNINTDQPNNVKETAKLGGALVGEAAAQAAAHAQDVTIQNEEEILTSAAQKASHEREVGAEKAATTRDKAHKIADGIRDLPTQVQHAEENLKHKAEGAANSFKETRAQVAHTIFHYFEKLKELPGKILGATLEGAAKTTEKAGDAVARIQEKHHEAQADATLKQAQKDAQKAAEAGNAAQKDAINEVIEVAQQSATKKFAQVVSQKADCVETPWVKCPAEVAALAKQQPSVALQDRASEASQANAQHHADAHNEQPIHQPISHPAPAPDLL